MGEVLEGVRQSNEAMSKLSAKEYLKNRFIEVFGDAIPSEAYEHIANIDTFVDRVEFAEAYHAAAMAEVRKEINGIPTVDKPSTYISPTLGEGWIRSSQVLAILDKHTPKP